MKLEEIHKVAYINNVNKDNINKLLSTKKHIKDNIYKIIDSGNEIYVIIINDEMIAYLYLIPFSNDVIEKGYISKEIWVNKNHRFQGYAVTLYQYIINNGYSILSDSEQTNDGISLWNKLSSIGGSIRVFDVETGKIYNRSDIPDIKIYGNDKYRLMLVKYIKSEIPEGIRLPEYTGTLLKPPIQYTNKELRLF